MTTRQATPGTKFFRRTSKSPWQISKQSVNAQAQLPSPKINNRYNHTSVYIGENINKNKEEDKQNRPSIKCIVDEANIPHNIKSSCGQVNKMEKIGRNCYQSSIAGKNIDQFKLTYIPIQTMSTIHSLPTGHQIINGRTQENTVSDHQTSQLKIELSKLQEQCRKMLESQKRWIRQKQSLQKQIENLKKNNCNLSAQMKKKTEAFYQVQKSNRQHKINVQNLRRSIQTAQYIKIKAEQSSRQYIKSIFRLESQVSNIKTQNCHLRNTINSKDLQIKKLSQKLQRIQKKIKMNNDSISQCSPVQIRPLRSKTISGQQNVNPTLVYQQNQSVNKLKQSCVRIPTKCSRHIQTDTCSLEVALRRNQVLCNSLDIKQNTIKTMQSQVSQLKIRSKDFDEMVQKLIQHQKLIQDLNEQIAHSYFVKMAEKYKYC